MSRGERVRFTKKWRNVNSTSSPYIGAKIILISIVISLWYYVDMKSEKLIDLLSISSQLIIEGIFCIKDILMGMLVRRGKN